jgi:hypothetical protein
VKGLAFAVLLAVLAVVPSAQAAGPSITYTITAGKPGNNGWFLSPVSAQITVSNATSSTCPAVYGPATNDTVALDCSAQDATGATVSLHLKFRVDTDAPVAAASPARSPDANGWYNHSVAVAFTGTDGTSGVAACTTATYSGPDTGSGVATGTCTDVAGNVSAPTAFKLQYDATPPSVSGSTARSADSGSWFNHAVGVSFSGSDATSGVASCTGSTTYAGPDTNGATLTGSCSDKAGNSAGASTGLQYDATAPAVSATVARPPDSHGWYTKAVGVTFAGSDALSGIAACSPAATYAGPDDSAAKVTGTCSDAAGNTATTAQTLRYDATAPRLSSVAVSIDDGSAVLNWKQPADTADVAVTRAPGRSGAASSVVYSGRAGRFRDGALKPDVAYRYTLTSTDDAGNRWSTSVSAKLRALFAPAPGGVVTAGARLAWTPVAGADYYNVQLFRNGHKVLTTWPVKPELRLARAWRYDGKRQTLRSGRYRWYVWPGHGPRPRASYGALIGSNWFRVR